MMHYLLILLIGYLLGCSNMAVYLAAAQNVDLRSGGSGNPGASNALILMGWRAGHALRPDDDRSLLRGGERLLLR